MTISRAMTSFFAGVRILVISTHSPNYRHENYAFFYDKGIKRLHRRKNLLQIWLPFPTVDTYRAAVTGATHLRQY